MARQIALDPNHISKLGLVYGEKIKNLAGNVATAISETFNTINEMDARSQISKGPYDGYVEQYGDHVKKPAPIEIIPRENETIVPQVEEPTNKATLDEIIKEVKSPEFDTAASTSVEQEVKSVRFDGENNFINENFALHQLYAEAEACLLGLDRARERFKVVNNRLKLKLISDDEKNELEKEKAELSVKIDKYYDDYIIAMSRFDVRRDVLLDSMNPKNVLGNENALVQEEVSTAQVINDGIQTVMAIEPQGLTQESTVMPSESQGLTQEQVVNPNPEMNTVNNGPTQEPPQKSLFNF